MVYFFCYTELKGALRQAQGTKTENHRGNKNIVTYGKFT